MQKRDKNSADDFEKISQVLRTRLSTHSNRMEIINQQKEQNIVGKENNDRSIFEQDDSSKEYLFYEEKPQPHQIKNKPKIHRQTSHAHSEAMFIESPQEAIPIKRTISRPVSEAPQSKKPSKTRYKKSENVGNQIINQKKIDKIFTMVCQPNRTITVNSLGHALQKFKLQFQVKDIVDMLTLDVKMTHQNAQSQLEEDEEQKIDLSVKMSEKQFKDMYRMIIKKSK